MTDNRPLYLPADWYDEGGPSFQTDPARFACQRGLGRWHLRPTERDYYDAGQLASMSIPLAAGDTISFVTIEDSGDAELTVNDDGTWSVSPPIPSDAEWIWCDDDPETGCSTVADLVRTCELDSGAHDLRWCVQGDAEMRFAPYGDTPRFVRQHTIPDHLQALLVDAHLQAARAMQRYPQPNYVISKVAEEAGEVVKAAIHCAEGRETPEAVRAEIVDAIGMLLRLYIEGDQVHGLPPISGEARGNG